MANMMEIDTCPQCGSNNIKKNGHIHNGKQNHRCKDCGRQFVLSTECKVIPEEIKCLVKKALLERNSLRGICRIFDVSMTWLLNFIVVLYECLPNDLNLQVIDNRNGVIINRLEVEADEMWSFVGKKKNKQWIWIALDAETKQVIAFFVGDRSENGAQALWDRIPDRYKNNAIFYTDLYESYKCVIPEDQHEPVEKHTGLTNHIERFNCTLRQRVSRLVRKALSFSKKLENHIGAIKYFICHYNNTISHELLAKSE